MFTFDIFFPNRSQSAFSWGNLPDDLLQYTLQIHASNIIQTAFRKSLLRRMRIVRTLTISRGHMHIHNRYRSRDEVDDAEWELPLVWNSMPLVEVDWWSFRFDKSDTTRRMLASEILVICVLNQTRLLVYYLHRLALRNALYNFLFFEFQNDREQSTKC